MVDSIMKTLPENRVAGGKQPITAQMSRVLTQIGDKPALAVANKPASAVQVRDADVIMDSELPPLPHAPDYLEWESGGYRGALTFVFQDGIAQAGGEKNRAIKASLFHPFMCHAHDNEKFNILGSIRSVSSASILYGLHKGDFSQKEPKASPSTIYDFS